MSCIPRDGGNMTSRQYDYVEIWEKLTASNESMGLACGKQLFAKPKCFAHDFIQSMQFASILF